MRNCYEYMIKKLEIGVENQLQKIGCSYMQKSKEEIINIVMLACSAAVFFATPIFLMEVIVDRCPFISFLYIVVSGFIYHFAMIDKDKKTVLIKWLISIPIGFFIWWSFVKCKYSLRTLNWVNPGLRRKLAA